MPESLAKTEAWYAVEVSVDRESVESLIISAFETNGFCQWIRKTQKVVKPKGCKWYYEAMMKPKGYVDLLVDDPNDDESTISVRVDRRRIQKAIKLMAEKWPNAMADVMTGHADAETGDTFMQLVVYGDVPFC